VTTLELITPSYAPDRQLCGDLVRSVRRFGPAGIRHTVVVPPRDLNLFAPLREMGATVVSTRSVMPRGFLKVPFANVWVSHRSPWPPVRGWIAQQIVKLQAVAQSSADAVLVVDSDVEFVRPFAAEDFLIGGRVPLYRVDDGVSADLPRHMLWDAVARRLLGLPPDDAERHPDYICWPCLWQPDLVRAVLQRVEKTAGRPWAAVIGRELHFSEMVLYGIYVDEVVGAAAHTTDMHCRGFSDERALDAGALQQFVASLAPADVALMLSAKSGTDLELRRAAIRAAADPSH
jgi:PAS domain-containing protein